MAWSPRAVLLSMVCTLGTSVAIAADGGDAREMLERAEAGIRNGVDLGTSQIGEAADRAASAKVLFDHAAALLDEVIVQLSQLPDDDPDKLTWLRQAHLAKARALARGGQEGLALQAIGDLTKLVPLPRGFLDTVQADPDLASLRADPAFTRLLQEAQDARDARVSAAAAASWSAEPLFTVNYSGPALEGGRQSTRKLRGKPTVLFVWGSWCRECRDLLPALVAVHETAGDAVNWLGLAYERGASFASARGRVASVQEKAGLDLPFPNLSLQQVELERIPDVDYPLVVVLDAEGDARARFDGLPDPELLEVLLTRIATR